MSRCKGGSEMRHPFQNWKSFHPDPTQQGANGHGVSLDHGFALLIGDGRSHSEEKNGGNHDE